MDLPPYMVDHWVLPNSSLIHRRNLPAAGGRWDVLEVKLAEDVVVFGHRSLALEDLNGDGGLVVLGSGEYL